MQTDDGVEPPPILANQESTVLKGTFQDTRYNWIQCPATTAPVFEPCQGKQFQVAVTTQSKLWSLEEHHWEQRALFAFPVNQLKAQAQSLEVNYQCSLDWYQKLENGVPTQLPDWPTNYDQHVWWEHNRQGHLTKDPKCPICMEEQGSRVRHYKKDPEQRELGVLHLDLAVFPPSVAQHKYGLVAGLTTKIDNKPAVILSSNP